MFHLAQQQFLKAAQIMGLDDSVRERLLFPQRTLAVTLPFRRGVYGQVETVFGYRVQHVLVNRHGAHGRVRCGTDCHSSTCMPFPASTCVLSSRFPTPMGHPSNSQPRSGA